MTVEERERPRQKQKEEEEGEQVNVKKQRNKNRQTEHTNHMKNSTLIDKRKFRKEQFNVLGTKALTKVQTGRPFFRMLRLL